MMGRNIKMAAVAFTAIITLTGCGTKLYDMTDEEQGLIANYSAYVVAKHNIYQQDGMTNATEKRGDMEDADDTEKVDEASPDNSLSQDNKTSEAGNDKSSNSQKEPSATQEKKVSLAEATGYGSLEITYTCEISFAVLFSVSVNPANWLVSASVFHWEGDNAYKKSVTELLVALLPSIIS